MRLVNIDDCNRELFYKQMGGKDSLITVETSFNMLMALPTYEQEQSLKWHLVADGDLPSDDREVLCVDVWGNKYVAFLKDNEWSDGGEYSEIEVSAWMELPKFEVE